MSAFACLVNIELSLKKLRTFAVQWGNGSRLDYAALTVHITVDNRPWVPVLVPLKGSGEFTHLGVCYNMNLANPELFDKAAATIDDLGMKVALCRLFPDVKKMVFETCIYMKVAYYAKFSPWTLSQYRALDDKVSKFYRMISKNRANIAGDLLYIPVKHGGLGLKRLFDIIQLNKLILVGRLITVGGPAGSAMESMVLRGFRAAGQLLAPGMGGTMLSSLGSVSWISSLVDWLKEIDIGLHRPGNLY
jgi:hypothetical protein